MSNREHTFPSQNGGGLPPVALIAPVLILGAVVFIMSRRNNAASSTSSRAADTASSTSSRAADTVRDAAHEVSRKGGSATRRAGLTMLISALENDAARRVVIIALKFARDRS